MRSATPIRLGLCLLSVRYAFPFGGSSPRHLSRGIHRYSFDFEVTVLLGAPQSADRPGRC